MLFNNYLETLLGSKVKVKILRALLRFQTKMFTSRELAGRIKVSHTAVLKSLGDLQGMNMIKIESHGASNLISLNRECYLFGSLKSLFDSEANTLNGLKEETMELLPKAKSIAIFGSIASKSEGINSDIDVLIITKEKDKANEIIAGKQESFSKMFGNAVSAYVMDEKEFKKKRNTAFVKGIIDNHVMVKGDKL